MRISSCEGTGMGAQVEEDGIGLPSSKGTDGHFVNSRDKQGGGSTGPETVGFNAGWRDVGDVLDIGSCCLVFLGDDGGGDLVWHAVGVVVGVQ